MPRSSPLLALLTLLGLTAPSFGQTVENSRFETGLSGWSVTPSLPSSAGAPGTVEVFDMDGPGPLLPGPAAAFQTGKQPGTPGSSHYGVFLDQVVELQAGIRYAFRLDWQIRVASADSTIHFPTVA